MKNNLIIILLTVLINPLSGQTIFISNNGKYGLKNSDGEIITKPKYYNIYSEESYGYKGAFNFKNFNALLTSDLNGPIDILNYKGEIVVDQVKEVLYLNKRNIVLRNKSWFLLDTNGEKISDSTYDEVIPSHKYNQLVVRKNGLWGIIDDNESIKIPFKYESLSFLKDSLILAKKNDLIGILDLKGKTIIPFKYKFLQYVDSSNIQFSMDDKNGIMDISQNIIVKSNYEYIYLLKNGFYCVKNNNKWGVLNKKKQLIIPITYDELSYEKGFYIATKYSTSEENIHENRKDFSSSGSADVYKRKGLISDNNEVLIPLKYNKIIIYDESILLEMWDSEFYYIDHNLKPIIPYEYKCVLPYQGNVIVKDKNFNYGAFNYKGEQIVEVFYHSTDEVIKIINSME